MSPRKSTPSHKSRGASKRKASSTPRDARAPRQQNSTSGHRRAQQPGEPPQDFVVVGVGASAGGFEAFGQLLRSLPPDPGFALVLVQHLDPNHESRMSELLARSSHLPVQEVTVAMRIAPNCVYVMPSHRDLVIENGQLILLPRRKSGEHLPVDQFFISLAGQLGPKAVGVLLSGNGCDGTRGLREIKAHGGFTFAQDEKSAKYPGMPKSASAAGWVDFVLPPEQIAHELVRLASRPASYASVADLAIPEAEPESEFRKVFAVLRSATGVDFSFYKQSTLKRRIARRMAVQKLSSLPEYVQFLEKYPNEVDALYQDFLINVTHFFRDPKVFQALKKKVFPRLLKNRPDEAAIRIWVPGCSSGEEVYSLAIALLEYMDGTTRHNAAIQIFATDISETAIARARAGIYPQAIQGDVSEERLCRFFTKTDGGYQIAKSIRDACVFARQNVVEDPPFSKMDLISCRNLLIYLGPVLQRKVMPIFHYALNPGGFLLLGSSESVGTFSDLFKPVDKHHRIFSKNVVYNRPEVVFTRMPIPMEPKWAPKAAETPAEFGTLDVQRQVDNLILKRYSPNAVIVNSNLEVLGFRGRTGPFMEHASGEASLNLLKMVKEDLVVEVRTALARAMKQGATVRRESIRMQVNGTVCLVDIEVVPFGAPPSAERFFLVLFRATPMAQEKAEVLAPLGPSPSSRAARHEIGRLQEELRSSKESLQAIIEEQEATNEELKSANEEIQSSNEELQSTNEEMETAKEELQSTNEELTTLNDELQNRNQELSLLNNDLRNLLSSVNLPIIMLGSDLLIRRFTPQAEKLFNLIPSDIGRRISDINPNLQAPDLAPLVSQVIDSLKIQEIEVQDRQGQWYSLRIRPYRTSDNKIDGAVIVLVDIDDLKKSFEDISEVIAQPVLTLYGDFRIFRANAAFYRMFRLNREATEDQLIFDLEQGAWNQPALHTMLEGLLARNNRVENVRFEADFPSVGRKAFLVNARRVQQETKGTQLILIAFESIGGP